MSTTSRPPASRPSLPPGARCRNPRPQRTSPPSPAGAGIDTVDIPRFERLLHLRGAALTSRVFTPHELAACRGNPARLAARFAAKEAAAKVLGTGIGSVGWRDIEVRSADDGAPRLVLRGAAARRARSMRLTRWDVSLTHDGGSAVAVVVASGPARTGRGRP